MDKYKFTKKFNDVEIDYYFFNSSEMITFLKNEHEKNRLCEWFINA
jgi:hypothetical protein